MSVSDQLKDKAISLGLCQEWQSEWNFFDNKGLMAMYKRGIHWCMTKGYPALSYVCESFDDKTLIENNIFVGGYGFPDNSGRVICRGDSNTSIFATSYDNVDVYMGDDSVVTIVALDDSAVTIHLYHDSELIINECGKDVKMYIYQYGGSIINNCGCNVKIFDKRNE